MSESARFSISTVKLRQDRHVVHARQRARDVAALLGFDHQEQIRLATAASELARNAFRYASGGAVEFLVVDDVPQTFIIYVTDSGPGISNLDTILNGQYVSKTGMGQGIIGTKRLLEIFKIRSSPSGTQVEAGKPLPPTALRFDANRIKQLIAKLAQTSPSDPFDEVERQNQELLKTLAELRESQEALAQLNSELEDTNRGVVALYAELDQRAVDLTRVSDLKTRFLSNLSHEFRTPLNSISSLSRLLLDRSDGELTPEQEKQINYIQRSAGELSELVNDLLDLSKVEAGKIDVKPRHFEVQELFGSLRGMLKPLLGGNSLDLIFEANPDIPPLYTDEGKISQILRNLISNALKFTRRGHIRVTAEADATTIIFRVADTGIGIAREDQERIFEEFVQIDGELQSKVRGTGLGLPLSKRLAELLEGSLEVESEVGVGSTFIARMPMRLDGFPTPFDPSGSPNGTGATILFIEDNRETMFVNESSLKNQNYHLVFTSSIPEARAAIRRFPPALIVLDRILDQKDCLHFILESREIGYTGPVLVVSVVDDAREPIEAGATAFLPKPIAPLTLVNTIREIVDGKKSKTILLAEDDEVTRYVLGDRLAKLGLRILEARNGRDAIRMATDYLPDAMFLDIIMPDLNGFEVLRELRSNPITDEIPVVVHSSKSLSNKEIETLTSGGAIIYPKEAFNDQQSTDRLHRVLGSVGIEL
ncbi:ATP-binding protein [Acidicapsa ligni]|uniref:ATP-binding protein n=1 Tax=Acidicapsa ligni TaxID=542300 RepID=UPI0021E02729|nr:ATP-binding protein [Acidicapsa ligni]